MQTQMKGLSQFFLDLRNTKDLEEENKRINLEMNNIQQKFRSPQSLNGYQRKKYICKLMYIYMLGFNDAKELGLGEALQLIGSKHFSEKQVGYLAISVLINREASQLVKEYMNDLMEMMHGALVRDLQSNNEDANCTAIQFIASKFNVFYDGDFLSDPVVKESDEMAKEWLELIDIVYSLSCSPIQSALIKKKAALGLLSLLKLYPQVILSNSNWIPRLLTLVDDKDIGVVTSCIPLVKFLITIKPQFVKSVVPTISQRLYGLVIGNNCPDTYFYYNIPAPWLIIKLLQVVEHFFLLTTEDHNNYQIPVLQVTDLDPETLNNLRQVVSRSIHNASKQIKGLPNRNSQSAILFQAVSLAVFLDASPDAIAGAINASILLLDSNETNTRYLALDALIKLSARASPDNTNHSITQRFDQHLLKLFELLTDKDISVRRKSLDLLYTVCNPQTYETVITKLLHYFPYSDFTLRSEIAIKIAVLAERFATDSTWYVTTMLKLLSIGGGNSNGTSYISNEVWERIVQIIVNNESLQLKSCKLIIELLQDPLQANGHTKSQPVINTVLENLIKVAAFILGEFGQIAGEDEETDHDPTGSPEQYLPSIQYQLLYEAYFRVSLVVRAMLLTTFFKFFVKFPKEDFAADIVDLFDAETQSIDIELQTRAYEYLKLATNADNRNLALAAVRPLPIFERKTSALMSRIGSVQKIASNRNRSTSFVNALKINNGNNGTVASNRLSLANNSSEHLATRQLYNHYPSTSSVALPTTKEEDDDISEDSKEEANPFGDDDTNQLRVLSPNWYSGYHRMCHYDAGIFYESQFIKIIYRIIKDGHQLGLQFTIINNCAKTTGVDITNLRVLNIESLTKPEDPNYILNLKQLPKLTVSDKTTMEIDIKIRNVVENNESPILSLTFMCGGSFNQLNLKFPVILLKTVSSTAMADLDDFKKRWLQIGELLGVEQGESTAKILTSHRYNSTNVVRLLSRLGFAVVYNTNDDSDQGILVMGAGILHTQKSKYGVLTTIKSIDAIGREFEVVVRCTGGGIPEIITSAMKEIMEGKF
ncbi:unnamed protein product [Debaryomyces tyrocola]|nr:unnamed protein product [Debaryomyces tyrocola]